MKLLNIAIEAAIEAGKQIMKIYDSNNFEVSYKEDNSPLTKADIISHKTILNFLQSTNIPILSEEGKSIDYDLRKKWKKLWIIDPIDGTKEFVKRNGEFTVNIALIENQRPIMGVIFAPVLKDLYYSDGNSSFKCNLNGLEISDIYSRSVKLPKSRVGNDYVVVASKSHMNDETANFINKIKTEHKNLKLVSKGSSLKLCLVAEGLANCYPRYAPTMEWDTAAGQAIVENSGYSLIDLSTNKPMRYNRKDLLNNYFVVK